MCIRFVSVHECTTRDATHIHAHAHRQLRSEWALEKLIPAPQNNVRSGAAPTGESIACTFAR
jgi:hypothetical protein